MKLGPQAEWAAAPLAAALSDENCSCDVRRRGPRQHWRRRWRPKLAALLKALEHADPTTRRRAAERLGRIGEPAKAAIAPLAKLAQSDNNTSVHDAALAALNQINLPEVAARALTQASAEIKELVKKLQGNDQSDAAAAAKALGDMGPRGGAAGAALALALRYKSKWVSRGRRQGPGRAGWNRPRLSFPPCSCRSGPRAGSPRRGGEGRAAGPGGVESVAEFVETAVVIPSPSGRGAGEGTSHWDQTRPADSPPGPLTPTLSRRERGT